MPKKDINDIRERINNSFNEYLNSGNKKLIKKFSKKRLLMVLNIHKSDNDQLWHKEIEKRVEEINRWQEKLLNWLVGAILGILAALVAAYFKGCLRIN